MEDDNINRYIRLVLLGGMFVSVAVMILGLVMFALSDGSWEQVPLSIREIIEGMTQGNPIAVIDLGILLLRATPLTRVIAALVFFAHRGETKFVIVAVLVLGVVGLAMVLGG